MCGIAGVITATADRAVAGEVRAMTDSLRHRGPDDEGYLSWSGAGVVQFDRRLADDPVRVGMGHRRLAIIDTTAAGWQPMRSRCGRFQLVFNGEVFNHAELREELAALGHRFESRSDTEVLLAAWQHWGESALRRCVGMFAFALLDAEAGRVLLVRDPFGIKPLYYASRSGHTAFASEIAPLVALPWVRRHVNAQSVFDYLTFGTPRHPVSTFFADVSAVPAAHIVEIPLGAPGVPLPARRYWQPVLGANDRIEFDEAAGHLRDLLTDSVRLHLRSDVPVGISISGGVDSSSILVLLRRLCGDTGPMAGFGYAAGGSIDESRWMELAADRAGVRLHRVPAHAEDLPRLLDRILAVQGEPFGSSSVVAQYRVFETARRHGIKVMLGGQGADELFAGYRPYLAVRLAAMLREGRLADAMRFWRRARRLPGADRLILRSGGELLPESIRSGARRTLSDSAAALAMNAQWFERAGVQIAPLPRQARSASALKDRLVDALERSVLPALLRYEDRNAMAFSIENRVPFLTTAIAEFAWSLPDTYLIDADARPKAVLRAAMRGLVPDEILDRSDKVAFATPQAEWLERAAPWVERTLASDAARSIPAFREVGLQQQWSLRPQQHVSAQPSLWRAVSLIRWAELVDAEFVA